METITTTLTVEEHNKILAHLMDSDRPTKLSQLLVDNSVSNSGRAVGYASPASSGVQNGGNTLLNNEQIEAIKSCVAKWSTTQSIMRACEELNELSLALFHADRQRQNYHEQLLEEMADVHIALKHLEIKYGNYQKTLNAKIDKIR